MESNDAKTAEEAYQQWKDSSSKLQHIHTEIDALLLKMVSDKDKLSFRTLETSLDSLQKVEDEVFLQIHRIRERLLLLKEDELAITEKTTKFPTFSRQLSEFLLIQNTNQLKNASLESSTQIVQGTVEDDYNWKIDPNDVTIDYSQKLGRGNFGTVYRGKLLGKEVAVKLMLVQHFEDPQTQEDFKKEITIMSKLRHPNLILLMGACLETGKLMMVTEYMSRGSVYNLLHPKPTSENSVTLKIDFKRKMLLAKGTAQGMNWLHQMKPKPLLHLDLKTSNLLVDENWVVKISDFGMSGYIHSADHERVGSPLYMAPEVLLGQPYDIKADVFSFSICLWELLTEKDPYDGEIKSISELMQQVAASGLRPSLPADTCPRMKELLQLSWSPSPMQRPSFSDMLQENVFEEIIIEHYISQRNNLGRVLWRENFFGRWTVSWADFQKAFLRILHIPSRVMPLEDIRFQCLKSVLRADEGNQLVTFESFASVLEWFGPFDSMDILDRIYALLQQKYFWGHLSSLEAEGVLSSDIKKHGNFIVRFSSSEKGGFSLTAVTNDSKIQHFRIQRTASYGYVLGKMEYESLDQLLKSKQLKHINLELNTKKPCSSTSPYERMFESWKRRNSLMGYAQSND